MEPAALERNTVRAHFVSANLIVNRVNLIVNPLPLLRSLRNTSRAGKGTRGIDVHRGV